MRSPFDISLKFFASNPEMFSFLLSKGDNRSSGTTHKRNKVNIAKLNSTIIRCCSDGHCAPLESLCPAEDVIWTGDVLSTG